MPYPGIVKSYIPIHFGLKEVVPKNIYTKYGEMAWRFLDARILYTADCLREYFELPLICNTWPWGGKSQYRGYRPTSCRKGAKNSPHRRGQALDLLCPKGNVHDMRLKIIEKNRIFPFLTLMEDQVNWLHVSVENVTDTSSSIKIINP